MNQSKPMRFIAGLLVVAIFSMFAIAGTTIVSTAVNLAQYGGTATSLGQKTASASIPVVLASDSSSLAVTGTFWQATQPVSGTFWQATQPISGTVTANQGGTWTVQPGNTANTTAWKVDGSAVTQPVSLPAVSAPTIAKVGATTTSAQLIAANATRKGIEIDVDCANTDGVAINFGASAAVYATHKQLAACANWQPPPGIVVTSAIQIISNTGTQNARVIEYP